MSDRRRLPIGVGVAGKEHAALRFAAREAAQTHSNLRIVHAYTVPPGPPTALSQAYGVDIEGSFVQASREVLEEALEFLAPLVGDSLCTTAMSRGPAPDVLLDESALCRLMVIGPDEALPWYVRLFESRVARRLADQARCPVVVVPDTWVESSLGTGVLLLLDGESTAHGPLRFAFEEADRRRVSLHIVHAAIPADDESLVLRWGDMTRVIEAWGGRYPGVEVETSVALDTAGSMAEKLAGRVDLLVLGRPHTHRLGHDLRLSFAQTLIEHAMSPVAVVPADYDG